MGWNLFGYDVLETIVELLVIGVCVFFALRFLQGTRGGGVIRGLIVLFVPLAILVALANTSGHFERLNFFAEQFVTYVFLLLIIIFQPELRQAAIRVGQTGLIARLRSSSSVGSSTISAISASSSYLSRNQFGGLIAIERENTTNDHTVGGQELDATISEQLLTSIFWPNNPLHDLGVVVRGDRILRASSQFPLADESIKLPADLGSRHRAAVGLSMRCDALIVIISEQTGRVSIADHGTLSVIDRDELEKELLLRLERKQEDTVISDVNEPASQISPESVE
ncbi:MAG: DNA integrity scanning protein DisA nucleotide-binding domain protein [Planctomycetes bacterium]|nr:DNA integrity scanning protein DisA nucleotide-binding domain protein [Planctomycetota bacterium]